MLGLHTNNLLKIKKLLKQIEPGGGLGAGEGWFGAEYGLPDPLFWKLWNGFAAIAARCWGRKRLPTGARPAAAL
jgi:hypothetical protein